MRASLIFSLILLFTGLTQAQSWHQLSQKPDSATNRYGAFVFSLNNKVYYGGGVMPLHASNGIPFKDLYEYDISTGQWLRKNDLPFFSYSPCESFTINGSIYVAVKDSNQLWQYQPSTDTWARKAPLPGNENLPMPLVINNIAFVIKDTLFLQYDPISDQWAQRHNAPTSPKLFPLTFSIGDFGYLVLSGDRVLPEFWRYDVSKDLWEKKTPFLSEKRPYGIAFTMYRKYRDLRNSSNIIDSVLQYGCIGLGAGTNLENDLHLYNPKDDRWESVSGIPFSARSGALVTTINQTAYIGDGYDGQGQFPGNLFNDWWSVTLPEILLSVGVDGSNNTIQSYPQPASSEVYLTGLSPDKNYLVTLYDALGRCLLSTTLSGQLPKIDLSTVPVGNYTLTLQKDKEYIPIHIVKN